MGTKSHVLSETYTSCIQLITIPNLITLLRVESFAIAIIQVIYQFDINYTDPVRKHV